MSCQGFDDMVEVATEFRTLARCADVASPRRPSRNLWRYRDYTAFQKWSSFCQQSRTNAANVLGQKTNLSAIITRGGVGLLRLAARSTRVPVRAITAPICTVRIRSSGSLWPRVRAQRGSSVPALPISMRRKHLSFLSLRPALREPKIVREESS
jgi:hypothetical protein